MTIRLNWTNEQDEYEITETLIKRLEELLQLAGQSEEVETGEVSLTFVDDEAIRELNRAYRDKDKSTDVLSFPMWEGDEEEIVYDEEDAPAAEQDLLGDIVISVPTALRQSEEYGHSLEREIGFLFVHGFLHLIGYDHEEGEAEETEMFAKQEAILQKAGLSR